MEHGTKIRPASFWAHNDFADIDMAINIRRASWRPTDERSTLKSVSGLRLRDRLNTYSNSNTQGKIMKGSKLLLIKVVSAAAVLTLGAAGLSQAAASSQKNVPGWVSDANRVASAGDSERVTIVAFLSLRNQAALKNLIAAQSTPSSPQYGRYLTPEQFHAQFSPPVADVQRVQRSLEKMGFHIDHTPDSGLFVRA